MRMKAYNGYEETIHIPLVISNPVLFPKAVQTSALASSVDIMPTLATIAGVHEKNIPTLRGVDLTPIIRDASKHPSSPSATVQSGVLFTTDELGIVNLGFIQEPACIRCLRQERWKIVMYFDPNGTQPSVYELYDLQKDPLEQNNMGNPSNPSLQRRSVGDNATGAPGKDGGDQDDPNVTLRRGSVSGFAVCLRGRLNSGIFPPCAGENSGHVGT